MKMGEKRSSILVVDDERDVRDTLREYLELNGFDVSVAGDGAGMRNVMKQRGIDVVLMDVNLPGEDGLSLTRELRSTRDVGIIMVTAIGQTVDRIVGLEMGADDYIAKPFELREVLARVRSVLRRLAQPAPATPPDTVKMGSCTLDLAGHRLYDAKGGEIPLTSMEFDLLKAFAEAPDRVLTREQLLELAHSPNADVYDRSVDLRIARLRRKVETDVAHPQVIKTVRGAGYIFVSGRRSAIDLNGS
jgi:two-component system, OmpR family, phosphate regulon response regulator OmpR